MNRKPFIITIDTESDNQWDLTKAQTTSNARYIPRFQELCEKYSFYPVYLVDYSMANDDCLVGYLKEKAKSNLCEIGMHLHAWDTPPLIERNIDRRPYLVEYSTDVMKKKIDSLMECLMTRFDQKIMSHRAGRWIVDERYLGLLEKIGIKYDCSVTPGIDWAGDTKKYAGIVDYAAKHSLSPYLLSGTHICEVPVSIHKLKHTLIEKNTSLGKIIKDTIRSIAGKNIWMRPSLCNHHDMKLLLEYANENDDYLEFMMHSSEFMPGGSPYYRTEKEIDEMYSGLNELFAIISEHFSGTMLKQIAID